jgi:diacylglycerol kinase (ATP)
MKKAKLIVNPVAGAASTRTSPGTKDGIENTGTDSRKLVMDDLIGAAREECERAEIKLDVEFTRYPRHATEIARLAKSRYDLVIAAGGDGTINEVINGIARSRTKLAVIPFGTVNVFAMELGIPQDFKEAARLITKGKTVVIDLGYAQTTDESRYYSMVLGVGFDALVMKDTSSELRKRWGDLAFLMVGAKHLVTYKWPRIQVEHSVTSTGYLVVVANSRHIWGEHQLADAASMTDGLLDLVLIKRKNWHAVDLLLTFSRGKLSRYLRKEYHQIKQAYITAESEIVVEVDGEIIGKVPVKVKVVPKALRVITSRDWSAGDRAHPQVSI